MNHYINIKDEKFDKFINLSFLINRICYIIMINVFQLTFYKDLKFMIMIWNRIEVFVGNSLQKFNEIGHILSSNGIKYDYKIVDSTSPNFFGASNRARTGIFGVNTDYTKMYYIYVHKKEYDYAQILLKS